MIALAYSKPPPGYARWTLRRGYDLAFHNFVGKTRKAGEDKVDQSDGEASNLAPSQLGYFGGLFSWPGFGFGEKEEYGTFKKEPPRRSLTDPPIGYRTPSPAQPYGIAKSTPRPTVTPRDPAVGDVGTN